MAEAPPPPDWPTCAVDDCMGVKVEGQEQCLAHVTSHALDAFLAALNPEDELDVRGTPISVELIRSILGALTVERRLRLRRSRFDRARFTGDASFRGAQFTEHASFRDAQFTGDASFDGVQFTGDASFDGAQFTGNASFYRAQFIADARFNVAQFSNRARFTGAQFLSATGFTGAKFASSAWFDRAKFSSAAWFDQAQFSSDALFDEAQFSADASFERAQFSGDATFKRAQLATAGQFGPLIVAGELKLDQAGFGADVLIEASAARLSCQDVTFKDATAIHLRFAQIALRGTVLSKPSTISFAREPFWDGAVSAEAAIGLDKSTPPPGSKSAGQPRVVSLRRMDLTNLVVADCDLSSCRFEGSHYLDKLRIEGPPPFAYTPAGWLWLAIWRLRLPIGRMTHRQALAEEHHWRSVTSHAHDADLHPPRVQQPAWYPSDYRQPDWLVKRAGPPHVVSADRLAVLYRGLRKAFEDSKNAPGAADFYYGEMEMRRLSPTSPWSDRLVLWTYWLVSGYGLRASRALAAFAAAVMLFSAAFWAWGLAGHPTYWTALLRTFESATSLLRPAPPGLTPVGELLDAILRLLGATLLGLALFSLRGRIKR